MQISRRAVPAFTAALIVATSAAAIGGQEVALRLKWTDGETLTYRTTEDSTVLMSGVPGLGDMTVTNVISQVQQMTTEALADDGTATVRVLFESMKMNVSSPTGSMAYDSADPTSASGDPATAQMAQALGALIGKSVTAVIAPEGVVTSVSGASEIMNSLLASDPQLAQTLAGLGGLGSMLTDDGMKAVLGQQFAFLPPGSVTVGDTWEIETTVPNPMGDMTVSTVLTLRGFATVDGHAVARIGTVQAITVAPGGMMGAMSVEIYDAYGQGEVLFDRGRGRIYRVTNQVTMPMSLSMAAPDGSAIAIEAVTSAKTKLELVGPLNR